MFVIIGYLVAIGCIFGGYIIHGGNIGVVLHALPIETMVICGGALGAFIVNNQPKLLKATFKAVPAALKGSKYTKARYMELLALQFDILQKARKEGLMAIEQDVENPDQSTLFKKYPTIAGDHHVVEFITDYLRMMVSGNLNAHEIESLMDSEIETHQPGGTRPGGRRGPGGRRSTGIRHCGRGAGRGEHHGLGGAAACCAGRHDRLGPGGYLPRHLAGLRHR